MGEFRGTEQIISAKQNQNIKEALTGASSILNIWRENRAIVLKPKQEMGNLYDHNFPSKKCYGRPDIGNVVSRSGCHHFISAWLGKLKPNKLSTGCQNELKGAAVEKATNPGRRFLFFSRHRRSFSRALRANFAARGFVARAPGSTKPPCYAGWWRSYWC